MSRPPPLFTLLLALLLASLPSPVYAASKSLRLSISSSIAGAIFIAVGIALVFFGFRLSRTLLFLAGAHIFSTLAYIALRNFEPANGYPSRDFLYLGVSIAAGFIGGFIFFRLYKMAILGLGAFAGFTLASYILTFRTGSVIPSGAGRAIFIVVLCILGAVLSYFFERTAVIASSSVIGAASVTLGVDVFAATGVAGNLTQAVLLADGRTKRLDFKVGMTGYVLLASGVVLAVAGIVVQIRMNRGREFMKSEAAAAGGSV
ncbi:hypothetical protein BJ742DRAFT_809360 [Cladochytrium replicatum]|nr:hypothetical protein BJ742DRAFT_809360 [Cladochytrium replicatum]